MDEKNFKVAWSADEGAKGPLTLTQKNNKNILSSPIIRFQARVTPLNLEKGDVADYELGFIQFIFQASYCGYYKRANANHKKVSQRLLRLPCVDLDSEESAPFYSAGHNRPSLTYIRTTNGSCRSGVAK